MPTVVIFDLDETLFQVLPKFTPAHMSDSAGSQLDPAKIRKNVRMMPDFAKTKSGPIRESVTPIARLEIKKILDDIYQVIKEAKEHGLESPIQLKIITAAPYTREHIMPLLDYFYETGDDRFTNGDFPCEFFNSEDLGLEVNKRKAELMDRQFNAWQTQTEQFGNLSKKDVFLIDNEHHNTHYAEAAGYSACYYATTLKDRPETITFTYKKAETHTTLKQLVSKAQDELDAKKLSLKPNPPRN